MKIGKMHFQCPMFVPVLGQGFSWVEGTVLVDGTHSVHRCKHSPYNKRQSEETQSVSHLNLGNKCTSLGFRIIETKKKKTGTGNCFSKKI